MSGFIIDEFSISTKTTAILLAIAAWLVLFWLLTPKTASETIGIPKGAPTYSQQFVYAGQGISSDIEGIIISKAIAESISSELLLRIARCESGLRPDARNKLSTASGLFQFLDGTFFSYAQAYELSTDNKNDPVIQAELAAKMIAAGGIGHWNESRSCWQF